MKFDRTKVNTTIEPCSAFDDCDTIARSVTVCASLKFEQRYHENALPRAVYVCSKYKLFFLRVFVRITGASYTVQETTYEISANILNRRKYIYLTKLFFRFYHTENHRWDIKWHKILCEIKHTCVNCSAQDSNSTRISLSVCLFAYRVSVWLYLHNLSRKWSNCHGFFFACHLFRISDRKEIVAIRMRS